MTRLNWQRDVLPHARDIVSWRTLPFNSDPLVVKKLEDDPRAARFLRRTARSSSTRSTHWSRRRFGTCTGRPSSSSGVPTPTGRAWRGRAQNAISSPSSSTTSTTTEGDHGVSDQPARDGPHPSGGGLCIEVRRADLTRPPQYGDHSHASLSRIVQESQRWHPRSREVQA